jgi:hypothetical protein
VNCWYNYDQVLTASKTNKQTLHFFRGVNLTCWLVFVASRPQEEVLFDLHPLLKILHHVKNNLLITTYDAFWINCSFFVILGFNLFKGTNKLILISKYEEYTRKNTVGIWIIYLSHFLLAKLQYSGHQSFNLMYPQGIRIDQLCPAITRVLTTKVICLLLSLKLVLSSLLVLLLIIILHRSNMSPPLYVTNKDRVFFVGDVWSGLNVSFQAAGLRYEPRTFWSRYAI